MSSDGATLLRNQSLVTETGSRAAKGSHQVVYSVINRIGILLLNVSTGVLTARQLHPTGRGALAAMILWPLFLASATTLGLPSSVIYHLRRSDTLLPGREPRDRRADLVLNALSMAFLLGIFATVCAQFLLPVWMHQYSPLYIQWARLFVLTLPLCSIMIVGQAILEGLDRFSLSNYVQIAVPIATLALLLVFLFSHHLNPITAGISYVMAAFPNAISILLLIRRQWTGPFQGRFQLSACRLLLGYGFRSAGIDLLGALALQIDQVLVVSLLAPAAMGAYVVVLSLSRMLNLFQTSVVMVLFPRAAGKSAEQIRETVGLCVRVSSYVTLASAVGTALIGPTLIRLLYGPSYLTALTALRILLIEIVLQGGVSIMAQAFLALGRPGIVTILQATGLSISIPLMLVLIPRLGLNGAALALLASTTARFLFVFFGFRVFLRTRLPQILPDWQDAGLIRSRVFGHSA